MIRSRIALACALALGWLSGVAAAEPAGRRLPNIVFFLADDLGFGEVGYNGQKLIQTPNIDKLAGEGMRLNNMYAGCTVCAPSRCVLMTGLHTGHCFIRGNANLALRPGDVTVAEFLKQHGYATAITGKWGLGMEHTTGSPPKQGYDLSYGYYSQTHAHNYWPEFLMRLEDRVPLRNVVGDEWKDRRDGAGVAVKKVDYSDDFIMNEALTWVRNHVEQHREQPFFLYLANTLPHANNEANKAIHDGNEVPDFGIYKDKPWKKQNIGHAAMIARLDDDLGKVMALLKEKGLDGNTLVIFSSDNGPHREAGNEPEFFKSAGPYRGIKRDLTDGGIHEPSIARWTGKIQPGSSTDHVMYFGDFFATAAELIGAEAPAKLDSISFLPSILGKSGQKEHEYLYWEFHEGGFKQAVRAGDWKAIRFPNGHTELYDLPNDLHEDHDLAKEKPDVVKKMQGYMDQSHVEAPEWPTTGVKQAKGKRNKGKKTAE